MKRLKFTSLLILACLFHANAQEKNTDPSKNLVSKGSLYFGFNTNIGAGFVTPENKIVSHNILSPKVGYFILNRLSVDLGYHAILWQYSSPKINVLHNAELALNYYFYSRKNIQVYARTGLLLGRYNLQHRYAPRIAYSQYMIGGGISWRFAKHPNFGINLESTYYVGTGPMNQARRFPNITVGFTYFLNFKKHKDKKTHLSGDL